MSSRPIVAAVVAAGVFAAAGLAAGERPLALARLALAGAALAAAALYDLTERRIPNRLVLPAAVGCGALTLAAGAPLVVAAGLAAVAALLAVSLACPHALGMGDVKLALLIVLGLDGAALHALALGLVLAALAGLVLLVCRGSAGWRASLPLAPFLASGALLAVIA